MKNPDTRRYVATHEWVKTEDAHTVRVGITEYAQDQLGDIVYVDLPEVGQRFAAGEVCVVIESVKAASDIHMPISGEISAVNTVLDEHPELINEDPFGQGWLFQIHPDNGDDINGLLNPQEYDDLLDI